MCRYVLIAIVVILLALMVTAALVVQAYGWQGFLVLVAVLVVLAYVARKVAPRFFMYLLTRPLRRMGEALHGARVVVHSVVPCERPSDSEYDLGLGSDDADQQDYQAIEDRWNEDDQDDSDDQGPEEEWTPRSPADFDWYQVQFTVTPPDATESFEGKSVHRHAWNPPLISAVGPRPELERASPFRGWPPVSQFTDSVHNTPAEMWDGDEFVVPEVPVFGEQRLRMRIGVARHIRTVTLTYAHYTDIGQVQIPLIDVTPEQDS